MSHVIELLRLVESYRVSIKTLGHVYSAVSLYELHAERFKHRCRWRLRL